MFDFLRSQKGFSYVEVLSVIAIIMIISTITMANMRISSSSGQLFVSAQKLVSDIRLAQNMALSSTEFNGAAPGGGWGIRFVKGQSFYSIFADVTDDFDISDHVCHNDCGSTSEELYKNIDLPPDATIDKIYVIRTVDGVEVPTDQVSVVFEPPDPKVYLCVKAGDCDYDKIGVVIVNKNLDKREIIVNFFGLVDTKDVYY